MLIVYGLVVVDGFSGIFWLYLNKGRYFASPTKVFLTVVNVFIVGVACCIVSLLRPPPPLFTVID